MALKQLNNKSPGHAMEESWLLILIIESLFQSSGKNAKLLTWEHVLLIATWLWIKLPLCFFECWSDKIRCAMASHKVLGNYFWHYKYGIIHKILQRKQSTSSLPCHSFSSISTMTKHSSELYKYISESFVMSDQMCCWNQRLEQGIHPAAIT